MTLKQAIKDFLKEEDGLTTVEYAVAGGVIAAGVVAAFTELGGEVKDIIEGITKELTGKGGGGWPFP